MQAISLDTNNRFRSRIENTKRRHQKVIETFNNLYKKFTRNAVRPDFDDVLNQTAIETGYSARTVKDILKS